MPNVLGAGGPLVGDVHRIAVLRGGGIGDLVFALPALEALRAAYPGALISLLAAPWTTAFLSGRPGPIDHVVPLPVVPGVHQPAGTVEDRDDLRAFVTNMREERFDLAIQIHGGGRNSNPLLRRLSARVTVGLRAHDAPPLARTVPYVYYQSEVMRDLEVVGLVGAPPVTIEPRLAVTPLDVVEAAAAVPETSVPLAVIHPGAGDPRRRWPVESFAAVGDALYEAGAEVLVTGSVDESELVRSVVAAMTCPAANLAGRLSLSGLAGVLSRAAAVVSNDSGPLHLAAAVGAATVGVYWCGNLINAGPFSRARHRAVMSWRLTCPTCGRDCTKESCEHADSFVADVPVEQVRDDALELLETARRAAARPGSTASRSRTGKPGGPGRAGGSRRAARSRYAGGTGALSGTARDGEGS